MEDYDIPKLLGARSIWDTLVEDHGEVFVANCRKVLPSSTGRRELVYRYAVAKAFLDTEREPRYEGHGEGLRSSAARRLDAAIAAVAGNEDIQTERVRQACVEPYAGSDKKEQFLGDLTELENELEECDEWPTEH